jgi:hypothetical protein
VATFDGEFQKWENMTQYKSDYEADAFGIYLALAVHLNYPIDMLEEDSLTTAVLSQYQAVVVTQPNLPEEGLDAVIKWVRRGGQLVTTSGAAQYDRYNTSNSALDQASSVVETSWPHPVESAEYAWLHHSIPLGQLPLAVAAALPPSCLLARYAPSSKSSRSSSAGQPRCHESAVSASDITCCAVWSWASKLERRVAANEAGHDQPDCLHSPSPLSPAAASSSTDIEAITSARWPLLLWRSTLIVMLWPCTVDEPPEPPTSSNKAVPRTHARTKPRASAAGRGSALAVRKQGRGTRTVAVEEVHAHLGRGRACLLADTLVTNQASQEVELCTSTRP